MNDKCSAGTGKFLEIMSNRLGLTLEELFEFADKGNVLKISSMCTVFAESEIIGLMGSGETRADIAAGVVDSVAAKVKQLAKQHGLRGEIVLTGGLSVNKAFVGILSRHLGQPVKVHNKGRFAGAIGAANIAQTR
jgi:predicted CoA-substrate-specific enzyme activase